MPVWEEHSYTRKDENGNIISLEEYEARNPSKVFSWADFKLYAICGVGFMLDSYDLFIVNLASPLWAYEFFHTGKLATTTKVPPPTIPFLVRGAVNAAANIGNIIGQISFGFMGDVFGRKFVYGKELIIAIVGIILIISLPVNGTPGLRKGIDKMWWLFGFRVLLGIGIGGDYPMSAAIVAERSTLANRGRMLGWIFSNQGWGTLAASIVTLILLPIFKHSLTHGNFGHIDAIWRLQIGVILVPCFALLYFRLTMPESRKFIQSTELSTVAQSRSLNNSTDILDEKRVDKDLGSDSSPNRRASVVEAHAVEPPKNVQMKAFIEYFSHPKHALTLFGCAASWFLVDVAFYGVNLNQSVILTAIGYSTGKTPYEYLLHNAEGNLIIAIAGYVPGYFLTIAFIELLGRKWIQIQGFLVSGLMFGILAGAPHLSSGVRFALIVIAQLFLNFGPNSTTFIVPGEVFPSRVRGLAHGFCAAVGKMGAILSGIGFNWWSQSDHKKYPGSIGLSGVLWIFFAFQMAGAVVTFFCVPETRGLDSDAIDYAEMQEKVARAEGRYTDTNA